MTINTMTKVIASLAFVALIAAPASARNNGEGMSAYPQFGAEPDGYWQAPATYVNRPHQR
jgi:hypothetical protein